MKFVSLYKDITLTVQGKYTKYTRVYKVTLCERFQSILNHFFLFSLSLMNCILVLYTLFNSHMKISKLSLLMMFREKNLTLSRSTCFQPNHYKHD